MPALLNSALEERLLRTVTTKHKITLVSDTTDANIAGYSDDIGSCIVYVENGAQPTVADAGANLGTLDSDAAPAVIGILIPCEDAGTFLEAKVSSIVSPITAAMTTGVVSAKGSSTTGVTALNNIAFTISCTALDLDSEVGVNTFILETSYVRKAGL